MSDEAITPKADKRILDGEVVNENPHSWFRSDKGDDSEDKPASALTVRPYLPLGLSGLALAISATLWLVQPDHDALVERMNLIQQHQDALQTQAQSQKQVVQTAHDSVIAQQTELTQLQQQLQQLQTQLEAQKPVLAQSDLDALSQGYDEVKQRLQALLEAQTTPSEQGGSSEDQSAWQAWMEKLKGLNPDSLDLTHYWSKEQATAWQQQWQTQLEALQQQVAQLLSEQTPASSEEIAAEKNTVISHQSPLTAMQLSQWAVALNTDWMLLGQVEQTKAKLLAFEQALSASELDNKALFFRLVGEDLAYLKLMAAQPNSEAALQIKQMTAELKHWVVGMTQTVAVKTETPVSHETLTVTETASQSAWEKLLDRLAGMFSLHKRTSEQETTQVEQMLQQDVLRQRALLYVERIEWALQTQDANLLVQAKADMKQFLVANYPQAEAEWTALADSIRLPEGKPMRQPLQIVGAW